MPKPNLPPVDIHVVTDHVETAAVARFNALESPSSVYQPRLLGETMIAGFGMDGRVLASAGLLVISKGDKVSGLMLDIAMPDDRGAYGASARLVRFVEDLALSEGVQSIQVLAPSYVNTPFTELGYDRQTGEDPLQKQLVA